MAYRRARRQVERVLFIEDALRGHRYGVPLAEFAHELDVSERTIRRDIDEMERAGVGIDLPIVDGRTWAKLRGARTSYVPITRRERYTLLAVRHIFDVLNGTPLHEDIESVLGKLEARMTHVERVEHESLGPLFAYVPDGGTKSYKDKADIIDELQTGIMSRKVVSYAYKNARNRTERGHLAPFTLLLYKQGLYIAGRRLKSPDAGHTLTGPDAWIWAIERFTDAEHLRSHTFTVPKEFDIQSLTQGAFGLHTGSKGPPEQVVIEFSKEKAAYVFARQWHPTQQFKHLPNGRICLTFTCTNLTPVIPWLLSWGPHARAISPSSFATAVRDKLKSAAAFYP